MKFADHIHGTRWAVEIIDVNKRKYIETRKIEVEVP